MNIATKCNSTSIISTVIIQYIEVQINQKSIVMNALLTLMVPYGIIELKCTSLNNKTSPRFYFLARDISVRSSYTTRPMIGQIQATIISIKLYELNFHVVLLL